MSFELFPENCAILVGTYDKVLTKIICTVYLRHGVLGVLEHSVEHGCNKRWEKIY